MIEYARSVLHVDEVLMRLGGAGRLILLKLMVLNKMYHKMMHNVKNVLYVERMNSRLSLVKVMVDLQVNE